MMVEKDQKITLAEGAFFENWLERNGRFLARYSFWEGSFSFSFSFLGAGAFLFQSFLGAWSSSSRMSQFSMVLSGVTSEIFIPLKATEELI